MPLLAILGLRDPAGADWSRLRGLQYAQLIRTVKQRIAVHAACAILSMGLYAGKAPIWLLGSFTAALRTGNPDRTKKLPDSRPKR